MVGFLCIINFRCSNRKSSIELCSIQLKHQNKTKGQHKTGYVQNLNTYKMQQTADQRSVVTQHNDTSSTTTQYLFKRAAQCSYQAIEWNGLTTAHWRYCICKRTSDTVLWKKTVKLSQDNNNILQLWEHIKLIPPLDFKTNIRDSPTHEVCLARQVFLGYFPQE